MVSGQMTSVPDTRHKHCLGRANTSAVKASDASDKSSMTSFFEGHASFLPIFAAIAAESSEASTAGVFASVKPSKTIEKEPELLGSEKEVVAKVLDYVQERMASMPKTPGSASDDSDEGFFIEEGQKMVAMSRIRTSKGGRELEVIFQEIHALTKAGKTNTGTLLALRGFGNKYGPGGDVEDFLETCVRQPLEWLGRNDKIDVEGLRKADGAPVNIVRIFYDLRNPTLPPPGTHEEL